MATLLTLTLPGDISLPSSEFEAGFQPKDQECKSAEAANLPKAGGVGEGMTASRIGFRFYDQNIVRISESYASGLDLAGLAEVSTEVLPSLSLDSAGITCRKIQKSQKY